MGTAFKPLVVAVVIGLGIMGCMFFNTATNSSALVTDSARTNGLIAGIVCVVLAVGVLLFAMTRGSGSKE